MKILLKGYFDSNFGDDYMMKIIVNSLPEYEFIIEESKYTDFILREKNVFKASSEAEKIPVLIVTGSGFMINSLESLKCEIKWFFKRKHIADYCMGCNIEPFSSKLKEYLIKKKLEKFRLIICRDNNSYEWLRKNCPYTNAYQLTDILFAMPEEWISKSENQTKLGISLLHRSGDKEDCEYYRKMADIADEWIKITGEEVILMAFDAGSEDDEYACKNVKKMMKLSEKAEIVLHGKNDEILRAYSRCCKIIGARFHSAVLAMRMNIDFFPIIYRNKMKNLISDIEYPVKGCYIDEIDYKLIKDFIENKNLKSSLCDEIIRSSNMYADIFRAECNERWD